jgi:hypothetical protein
MIMSIEHGKYVYVYKDEKVGISISKAGVVRLGDNDEKAFKRVIGLALSHPIKDKFK